MLIQGKTQVIQGSKLSKRTKENFDFGWQFNKGNINIKCQVQGVSHYGLTDVNIETNINDTVIDYPDLNSYKVFNPANWKEVIVPQDWAVEGTFLHDNAPENQQAINDNLLTNIGFYKKEFEMPEEYKGNVYEI